MGVRTAVRRILGMQDFVYTPNDYEKFWKKQYDGLQQMRQDSIDAWENDRDYFTWVLQEKCHITAEQSRQFLNEWEELTKCL